LNYSVSAASGLHSAAATYSTPAGDLDPVIAALALGASGPGLPGSSAANASPSSHSLSANTWSVNDYWSFTTSTVGFTGVEVAFDQAGSNTGPGTFGLFYSINGGALTQSGANYTVPLSTWNTTTAAPGSQLFAGGGAFDNATTITFELVDMNTVSVNGGTVATGGTDRVDNFTVVGMPVPEPEVSLVLSFAPLRSSGAGLFFPSHNRALPRIHVCLRWRDSSPATTLATNCNAAPVPGLACL